MKTTRVAIIFLSLRLANAFCDNCVDDTVELNIGEIACPVRDVAFVKIAKYRGYTDNGAEYQKTFFASKYLRTDWFGAKVNCKAFNLELATFETLTEAQTFLNMAWNHNFIMSHNLTFFLIDGMTLTPKSTTDWYWTKNGEKISFKIPWQPDEPNFEFEEEHCLSVWIQDVKAIGFNDCKCQKLTWPFICQRIDYYIPIRAN
ncbi:unnamed protein product [Chironomus riparius]|uniref:C-type lectin n=1 Tax=Chironomus riparius TaxID=315576 RepID=A0A9N9RXD6_9DIPT|nr:unnamed protein product [Chironomus riparius]